MSSSDENNAENSDVGTVTNSGARVDTPNPNDVLCGRGGNINSHRGNEQFRSFVEKRKRVYLTARFKREKRLIASSIVNEIRAMDPPGRFLARKGSMKNDSGYWYDIGDEKARDKTSQALRENAPSIRAEIETEINQQRAEMRRQETAVDQPSASAKIATNDTAYAPPSFGRHHVNSHGPVHHGQQCGHPPHPPPPHLGHSYNPAHQSHYTQQYYDYYYHYYGYSAPPPPPPPGYTSSGTPVAGGVPAPAPPPGYHQAPPPYWAGNPNVKSSSTSTPPPLTTSASPHPSQTQGSSLASSSLSNALTSTTATDGKRSANTKACEMGEKITSDMNHVSHHSPHPDIQDAQSLQFSNLSLKNQEDQDRRLAMALQQEENAKAFQDRNRRFGSDRRSSRSTAYCAPGYRPRLLNDSVDVSGGDTASSPTKKKRPAMSASHYFGPHTAVNKESTIYSNCGSPRRGTDGPITSDNINGGSNSGTNTGDHYDVNLKPGGMGTEQEESNGNSNTLMSDGLNNNGEDKHNHHDFSCSSFSSKGRLQFKDDSDVMSLFGEGDTIIPPSNASTGSFNRVRNSFAAAISNKNNNGSHHFNPITLDHSESNQRQQQRLQQRDGSRSGDTSNSHNQDSSLLSQVAHHILGNFGGGGGEGNSSWTESVGVRDNRNPSKNRDHVHLRGEDIEPEMEVELGQEVIMDVRDESSSMPPPNARGSGTQIDWPSRAGCHSWIPDAIDYSTVSSAHFVDHNNNADQHGNHNNADHHAQDHSLTRQTSYSRADISPINSMDMDFSQSSNLGGRQRNGIGNVGTNASSSLMNVFDQKNDDSNTEELLPHLHRSFLQREPSWERSYRSRSPVSLGEMSGANGKDISLIRVNSHVVKEKLFGIVGKSSGHQDGQQSRHQNHHPPQSQHQASRHFGHQDHNHEPISSRSQNIDRSHDIDMDWN